MNADAGFEKLPHNIEAEQALLGAILVNNDAMDNLPPYFEAQCFYEPLHEDIFTVIARKIEAGELASPVTLDAQFKALCKTYSMENDGYHALLAASATTVIGAPEYARTIYQLAVRRDLILEAQDIVKNAQEFPVQFEISELIDDVVLKLVERQNELHRNHRTKHLMHELAADLLNPDADLGKTVLTGIGKLDNKTGGLKSGEFYLLGGRPGMGKSALGIAIALNAAREGHGVLYYSGEMTGRALTERAATDLAYDIDDPIPYEKFRKKGEFTPEQFQRIKTGLEKVHNAPLIIETMPSATPQQIAAACRTVKGYFEKSGRSLDLLVVDHLHKMAGNRGMNLFEKTSYLSNQLAHLAKRFEIPVLCLIQLNRETERRDDKRPGLSDLRLSGELEQDADAVFMCYRPAYYLQTPAKDNAAEADRRAEFEAEQHIMEIIVAKQRAGSTGTVKLWCDIKCNAIRSDAPVSKLASQEGLEL